jgi:uncharacterized protein (TIGR02145 family)
MNKRNGACICAFILSAFLLTLATGCNKSHNTPSPAKKDPVITWSNPADIVSGTLIGAVQLNATANVPGTFVYTPASGAKLNEGAGQSLKADFTPTDATTYNTANKTVTINVTKSTVGTATDIDGNVYQTVTIGTQTWMASNLRTTKYNDGTPIPNVTDNAAWAALLTPGVCSYNNTTSADTIGSYGLLYNWYAVNTGKLCPSGWHVPTLVDWNNLIKFLTNNNYDYDSSMVGNLFAKSLASTSGWKPSAGKGAVGNTDYPANRNRTGFTAQAAGYRGGAFINAGFYATWWSATASDASTSWYLWMDYQDESLFGIAATVYEGFSIRCISDN